MMEAFVEGVQHSTGGELLLTTLTLGAGTYAWVLLFRAWRETASEEVLIASAGQQRHPNNTQPLRLARFLGRMTPFYVFSALALMGIGLVSLVAPDSLMNSQPFMRMLD